MARRNLSLPDELAARIDEYFPGLNLSGVLQKALQGLLECPHASLRCTDCGGAVDAHDVARELLARFYDDVWWAVIDLVQECGTAEGAAKRLRDSGRRFGIEHAEQAGLPRPSRAVREAAGRSKRTVTSEHWRV